MWWLLAAVWAASVGVGWYVGRQSGDTDTEASGIGWPLILGPIGLAIFLLTSRRAPAGQSQQQPE